MVGLTEMEVSQMRYERKFLIDSCQKEHVQSLIKLHPALFSESYPVRRVNNIYFDTAERSCYFANETGASERAKVRIRWYGSLFGEIGNPSLEYKIKRNMLGSKLKYSLAPFSFYEGVALKMLDSVYERSDLPLYIIGDLKLVEPVLVNRYWRRYYESADKKFRITLDWNMEYCEVNQVSSSFRRMNINDHEIVLELKYDEAEDVRASEITNSFSFRLSKNSKYVNGVNCTRCS